MKLRNILSLFIALAAMCSSCSEWLDYTPKDKTTADQQFSTRDGFYSAVNGLYNRLGNSSLYGSALSFNMIDLMARRYMVGSSNIYAKYNHAYWDYSNSTVQSSHNSMWSEAYSSILNANVILDYTRANKDRVLSKTDASLIEGEMLAYRAMLHFDMLRLFGPAFSQGGEDDLAIPYNNSAEGKTYDILPANVVVKDYILQDLNAAEALLREVDPMLTEGVLTTNNEEGDNYMRYRQLRLNYYAVVLLKARVYQWIGDNANALVEAKKIVDNPKVKEMLPFVDSSKLIGNVINPDRVFSTEVLFGLYNKDRDNIYDNYFDATALAGSSNLLQPRSGYMEQLFPNEADFRYQSQWSSVGSMHEFVKFKKVSYSEQGAIPVYAHMMPLMRVSEAYYIAAESLLSTDLAAAKSYLNTILSARGALNVEASASASAVLEEIQKEYLREFAGEGQIFFMMKRHNLNFGGVFNADNTTTYGARTERYVLPTPTAETENR